MTRLQAGIDENGICELLIREFPGLQAIYLFGSVADGSVRPDSDVDLGLLLPPEDAAGLPPSLALHKQHQALEHLLRRDVDLLNLRRATTVVQKEVVVTGRRIACPDPVAADEFDIRALSGWQKLNQERAEILENFHRTGQAWNS